LAYRWSLHRYRIEERPKIAKRLSDLQERMTRAGFTYEIIHAAPESDLDGSNIS
jgi:hypothetical protein